jgi:hypothetical protein
MRTRRWQGRFGAVAAGVLLAAPAMASPAVASVATVRTVAAEPAHTETLVAAGRTTQGRAHQQSLPDAGFDGMAVAAIGTGLTGAGWFLMLVGSRQLRRRSR